MVPRGRGASRRGAVGAVTAAAPRGAERADGRRPFVWLASYLKSGNTWTRLLLANFLADSEQAVHINDLWEALPGFQPCERDWFDRATGLSSSDFTDDEVEPLRPAALRAHAAEAGGAVSRRRFGRRGLPGAQPPRRGGLLGFPRRRGRLFRDRDANERSPLRRVGRRVRPSLRQRLLDWSGHVESWRAAPFPVLAVRYEDLLADAVGQLGRMTRFLGLEGAADGRRLRRAVAASDFTRLQEQEREARDGFHERDRRCRRFFRSGRSGDWRRHLSATQALRVARRHGAVMRACGYDPREAEC